MKRALGLIEVTSWTVSMAVLDRMEKAAGVELLQIELNDFYGTCIKVTGKPADIRAALEAGKATAESLGVSCVIDAIDAPDRRATAAFLAPKEYNPLIESNVIIFPHPKEEETLMAAQEQFAIGMIETQGFTAVIEAIDTACKAANVEVVGREKLGGGYITVLIKGDVAAVNAAVEAGVAKVDGLGKLIAGHVIPRPSQAILSLLPKVQ